MLFRLIGELCKSADVSPLVAIGDVLDNHAELALPTVSALARSQSEEARRWAAGLVGSVYEMDHDAGVRLYVPLLVDESPDVRLRAEESVEFAVAFLEMDPHEAKDLLGERSHG